MNHRGIWLTATVLAVIVLLAQIAGASTRDETTSLATSASVSVSDDLTGTAARSSLAEQASSVASVASEKSANADEAITTRARTTETAQNEVTVSAPAAAPTDSTTGARPGWGCGDTNHKHSGPPGRPGATPPPGCASR